MSAASEGKGGGRGGATLVGGGGGRGGANTLTVAVVVPVLMNFLLGFVQDEVKGYFASRFGAITMAVVGIFVLGSLEVYRRGREKQRPISGTATRGMENVAGEGGALSMTKELIGSVKRASLEADALHDDCDELCRLLEKCEKVVAEVRDSQIQTVGKDINGLALTLLDAQDVVKSLKEPQSFLHLAAEMVLCGMNPGDSLKELSESISKHTMAIQLSVALDTQKMLSSKMELKLENSRELSQSLRGISKNGSSGKLRRLASTFRQVKVKSTDGAVAEDLEKAYKRYQPFSSTKLIYPLAKWRARRVALSGMLGQNPSAKAKDTKLRIEGIVKASVAAFPSAPVVGAWCALSPGLGDETVLFATMTGLGELRDVCVREEDTLCQHTNCMPPHMPKTEYGHYRMDDGLLVIPDVKRAVESGAVPLTGIQYQGWFACYVGCQLLVGGASVGTLCFAADQTLEQIGWNETHEMTIRAFANTISEILEGSTGSDDSSSAAATIKAMSNPASVNPNEELTQAFYKMAQEKIDANLLGLSLS